MSATMSDLDKDMLSYMTNLKVRLGRLRLGRRGEMIYPGKQERAGLLETDFTLLLHFVPSGGRTQISQ